MDNQIGNKPARQELTAFWMFKVYLEWKSTFMTPMQLGAAITATFDSLKKIASSSAEGKAHDNLCAMIGRVETENVEEENEYKIAERV